MNSRRNFLRTAAIGTVAGSLYPALGKSADLNFVQKGPADQLKTGIAGYTFVHFDIDQSIAMMKRVNVKAISLKDFHLPLNSSQEKINEVLGKFSSAGITVYAVGVIYMKSKEAVDQAFEYARKVGVSLIVGVPTYDLVSYTEQKVKETNIRVAIHNHGPEDKLYPGPQQVYDRIKDLDHRMGLCLDIGHAQRAGVDPVTAMKRYGNRIYDMHVKDVTAAQKDGKAIEVGRGIIDFPGLIKILRKQKYQGHCSLEFEKDMKDPLPGIAESAGYFRGVMAV